MMHLIISHHKLLQHQLHIKRTRVEEVLFQVSDSSSFPFLWMTFCDFFFSTEAFIRESPQRTTLQVERVFTVLITSLLPRQNETAVLAGFLTLAHKCKYHP